MKKILRKIIYMSVAISMLLFTSVLGNNVETEMEDLFKDLEINAVLINVIKNEFSACDELKDIGVDIIQNDIYRLSIYKNHVAILLNSMFKEEMLNNKIFSENFAGSFIDEGLNLNICLINDMYKEKYIEFFNSERIVQVSNTAAEAAGLIRSYRNISDIIHVNFVYCENSYDELMEVYDILKYNIIELGISQLYIDESDNKVYAHIENEDKIEGVELFLKNKNLKLSIIEYIIDDGPQYVEC